jgi:hypothetical protein
MRVGTVFRLFLDDALVGHLYRQCADENAWMFANALCTPPFFEAPVTLSSRYEVRCTEALAQCPHALM